METQKFIPDLKIVDSSSFLDCNPQSHFPFKIKPDISIYPADTNDTVKTDFSLSEIFIEFKWNSPDDPFCMPVIDEETKSKYFCRNTKAADDTLGQITSYAAAQLGAQFRTHIYSVFVFQATARILRWDRSGTIVTEAFNYNELPFLAKFFHRYSKSSPEMRGKDETVSIPTSAEQNLARKCLALDETTPLVKLSIPDASSSPLYYVVSIPHAMLYTPPGRATRGFEAYNIFHNSAVYVKDLWRIDLQDITAEGLIYAILESASVCNIPACIASGDISTADYHATKSHTYATKPWACLPHAHFIPHRHYRLALNVIVRGLVEYNTSHEMVSAVRDAVIGESFLIWLPVVPGSH
jgi:hypothetical protein